jgi:outer membrane protein OmpA-like peptidoglycan-associated protein
MGASHFVASNRTAAGREKNRRVQIVVPKPSS